MLFRSDLLLERNKAKKCFEIVNDNKEGRYLRATQDLTMGDLILDEVPLIRYPASNTLPVCLGCFTPIDWQNCLYCAHCNFPMCCEECLSNEEHQSECQYFSNAKVDGENFNFSTYEPTYNVIFALRVLALKNTEHWKGLMALGSPTGNQLKIGRAHV